MRDAFTSLANNTEQIALLSRMDKVRLNSRSVNIAEHLLYCQFWCCLIQHITMKGITMSDVPLWFKCEIYTTDCYWFELLFHLYKVMEDLLNKMKKSSNVNDVAHLVSKAIGCYTFLNTYGMQFEGSAVDSTYSRLHDLVQNVRQHLLFHTSKQYFALGQYKQAVGFACAFLDIARPEILQESNNNNNMSILITSDSIDKVRLDMLRAWSKFSLESGNCMLAVRVLQSDQKLKQELDILTETLSFINNGTTFTDTQGGSSVLNPPRFPSQLLLKGETPYKEYALFNLFPDFVESPPPPPIIQHEIKHKPRHHNQQQKSSSSPPPPPSISDVHPTTEQDTSKHEKEEEIEQEEEEQEEESKSVIVDASV